MRRPLRRSSSASCRWLQLICPVPARPSFSLGTSASTSCRPRGRKGMRRGRKRMGRGRKGMRRRRTPAHPTASDTPRTAEPCRGGQPRHATSPAPRIAAAPRRSQPRGMGALGGALLDDPVNRVGRERAAYLVVKKLARLSSEGAGACVRAVAEAGQGGGASLQQEAALLHRRGHALQRLARGAALLRERHGHLRVRTPPFDSGVRFRLSIPAFGSGIRFRRSVPALEPTDRLAHRRRSRCFRC